ncbi:MAG: hypothetical protein ACLTC3_12975 [Evtepia gabavorous]
MRPGARPIDLHIRAFQALGAQVRSWNGRLSFYGPRLHGRRLALPIPSVGATENAMLAACGAQGITVIDNPAREPEIVDLQGFLRSMGPRSPARGPGRSPFRGAAGSTPGIHGDGGPNRGGHLPLRGGGRRGRGGAAGHPGRGPGSGAGSPGGRRL